MFSQKITESDAFLDMPLSSQALYFHLCMYADDDGFVKNPKRILKMINATDDDFKLLIAKAFIILYESGIIVIKHWKMHNAIRKDRYHPSDYVEEKSQLYLKENQSYTLDSAQGKPLIKGKINNDNQAVTKCQPSGNQLVDNLATEIRLDKTRLDKNRLDNISSSNLSEEKADKCDAEKWFDEFWNLYPRKTEKKKAKAKFLKICKDEITYNTILVGLKRTIIPKAQAEGTDYIPYPSTWLNGERWNDEPYKPKQKQKKGDWNFTDF